MSPLERWSEFMAKEWKAEVSAQAELDALFRHQITVTKRRGEVKLFLICAGRFKSNSKEGTGD